MEDTASMMDIAHRAYPVPVAGRRVESLIYVSCGRPRKGPWSSARRGSRTGEVAERLQGAGFSALPLQATWG